VAKQEVKDGKLAPVWRQLLTVAYRVWKVRSRGALNCAKNALRVAGELAKTNELANLQIVRLGRSIGSQGDPQ
jgi:hypothetical protein